MNRIMLLLFISLLFIIACSTTEEEQKPDDSESCGRRLGYLYKDSIKFSCPFSIQKEVGYKKWIDLDLEITNLYILSSDITDNNFLITVGFIGLLPTYGISMRVPKSHFTEEQYTVSIWAIDENFKPCGEQREFIFHRIEENSDTVTYHSVVKENYEDSEDGRELFFAENEISSGHWYKVLKVCSTEENKGFRLEGVVL
jgi:hypothetical protein